MEDTTRSHLSISIASAEHREDIYRMRHDVYAAELGQYESHPNGVLKPDAVAVKVFLYRHNVVDNADQLPARKHWLLGVDR